MYNTLKKNICTLQPFTDANTSMNTFAQLHAQHTQCTVKELTHVAKIKVTFWRQRMRKMAVNSSAVMEVRHLNYNMSTLARSHHLPQT